MKSLFKKVLDDGKQSKEDLDRTFKKFFTEDQNINEIFTDKSMKVVDHLNDRLKSDSPPTDHPLYTYAAIRTNPDGTTTPFNQCLDYILELKFDSSSV